MDRKAEGLLCFQNHWGRDPAENHVVCVLFLSSDGIHWWSSTGRISNTHSWRNTRVPFHVVLICISTARTFSGTPRKWPALPQAPGDGKESVMGLQRTLRTPPTRRLYKNRALTQGVPQTQGQKTEKEKLKEAGMLDLWGGRLPGGRTVLEGQHAGEGSDVFSRARSPR